MPNLTIVTFKMWALVRYPVPNFTFIGARCRPCRVKNLLLDYWVKTGLPVINQFKNKLDRHWSEQEMMYDYKAELAGILSRSNAW